MGGSTMSYSLGQKIRELRIRKGLTQGDLSAGLVTPSMVSQIESDKANPSHQLLCAIAERLETPIEYFLTDVQTQMENVSAYQLACAYIGNQQYEQAIPLLLHLKESHATHVSVIDVSYQLAICYLETGKFDKAAELFDYVYETAMTKKDHMLVANVQYQLARIAFERKEFPIAAHYLEKAYEYLQQAGPVDPLLYAKVVQILGEVYTRMGDSEKAKHFFAESYESMIHFRDLRKMGDTYLELSATCREQGYFERAAEYAQIAASIYRSLQGIRQAIDTSACFGILLGREGHGEQAATLLDNSIQRYREYGFEKNIGKLYEELARVLLQVGRYDEAVDQAKKALQFYAETGENKVEVYRLLTTIYLVQDNLDEAERWLNEAELLLGQSAPLNERVKLYALQSEIYKKRNKHKEAIQCLERMADLMEDSLRERKILI
jgi:HTH-type transcriptional regulator, quorum sensing regulator NprR